MKQISYPSFITPKGAEFASTKEALVGTTIVRTDAPELDYAGTVLSMVDPSEKKVATVGKEFHTFIIGETGCGKTRRVILPTIRMLGKTGRSMVITDPKGELYEQTANDLKKRGYNVVVLDFRDPGRSVRWNPFDLIETLYRSDSTKDKDQALLMLQDLADTLKERIHSSEDAFWEVAGAKIFMGVCLLIIEHGPKGSLTFENVAIVARKLFASMGNKMRFKSENGYDPYTVLTSLPENSPIASCLSGFMSTASDTAKGMLAIFEELIGLYVTQYSLLDLFCKSEFNIEDIGKKATALFLIVPDDSAVLYPIATVFIKQVYSALIRLADSSANDKLENEVSFVLDEFANFAPFKDVDSMLTAARSRGITFTLVCQSMEQLEKKYPRGVSEILMSNCRVWMYMSSRNYNFLARLRNLVGEHVDPFNGTRRPLIEIHELQNFRMGQVLTLYDRNKPAFGFLPDYSEYDFGEAAPNTSLPPRHAACRRVTIDPKKLFLKLERAHIRDIAPESKLDFDPRTGMGFRTESVSEMIARIDAQIAEIERKEKENGSRDEDDQ
ncbi:MAG: type IV secretory system conjugative DNA transfer family protein [Clostridia bacterium]|nr:type IV secretory system conjugative DNA transfer family protein [Clostridia bacterium]